MNWSRVLIRYGELSTKGTNRRAFTLQLRENIKRALPDIRELSIQMERDRMFISAPDEDDFREVLRVLPRIFGIQSFSPIATCGQGVSDMEQLALRIVHSMPVKGRSFRVTVRRTDKQFPLSSMELQRQLASYVLARTPGLTVQLKKPDIDLRVEVRDGTAHMMADVIKGAGGMPIGSNGKTLLMLSGGIDSPVAGYMMFKRGVRFDAIHFHSPPFTSEASLEKVKDLAQTLSKFGASLRLHVIPFTAIQQAIRAQIPENVSMATTRRLMLKIADLVREDIGAYGIVTGESLGQVASQTLESMTAINAVTATPVLRPLLSFDKQEIIALAERIGTYPISIRPYEDCCALFSPAQPKTKPKLEKLSFYESFVSFDELAEQAARERAIYRFPQRAEEREVSRGLL